MRISIAKWAMLSETTLTTEEVTKGGKLLKKQDLKIINAITNAGARGLEKTGKRNPSWTTRDDKQKEDANEDLIKSMMVIDESRDFTPSYHNHELVGIELYTATNLPETQTRNKQKQ